MIMNTKLYDIKCPQCDSVWSVKGESVIHAQNEKMARDAIMKNAFFTRKCSKCGTLIQFRYPFLYCDPKLHFLIALDDQQGKWIETLNEVNQYKKYIKRIVFTEIELKEKIAIFEAGLNDASIAVVKQKLKGRYQSFRFESLHNEVLWFLSEKGMVGIEKRFYVDSELMPSDFELIP